MRMADMSENRKFNRGMNFAGIFVVAAGILMVMLLYRTGRSLWLDEAFLAYSVSKRSLLELAASTLNRNQTAPILYLFLVKIITLLFGNTEFSLRIFSFFSYLGMLSCAYYLLSRVYKLSWPVLGVGFIGTMKVLLYYANEFKPYMSDCFFILLVLVLYDRYKRERIGGTGFTAISVFLVWASSPVIFFLGAIYIYEFAVSLKKKEWVGIRKVIFGGGLVLISFLANYWYWLRPVAQSEFMIGYWEDAVFPLFILSFEDVRVLVHLLLGFSKSFTYSAALLCGLAVVGAITSVVKKEGHTLVILLGIMLTMVASSMGKYPFNTRLVLFLYPLLGILAFMGLEALTVNLGTARKIISAVLVGIILLSNYSTLDYLNEDARYRHNQEINNNIRYVQQEIQADEKLYVNAPASSAFLYRNNYDEQHIGEQVNQEQANIIMGETWDMLGKHGEQEIQSLLLEERVYLLFTMNRPTHTNKLFDVLGHAGYLELVREEQGTPLYYYSQAVADVKSRAGLRLLKQQVNEQDVSLVFEISAGPDAYLKHEQGQMIYIVAEENAELEFQIEKRRIAPGESIEKTIKFEWPEEQEVLSFSLRSEFFLFDELGMKPVIVSRELLYGDR